MNHAQYDESSSSSRFFLNTDLIKLVRKGQTGHSEGIVLLIEEAPNKEGTKASKTGKKEHSVAGTRTT